MTPASTAAALTAFVVSSAQAGDRIRIGGLE
jgi:hypothetical protein